MGYTIVIISAALILGFIDIKDQIKEENRKPYWYMIKLVCMIIIIACIIKTEMGV